MAIIIFFILHWYLSLFCQTFFLHRYAAHKMFRMSPLSEKFFYILTFLTQGSSYLSPRAYGILHRLHHLYADTEKDPHSPKFSTGFWDMMWKTKTIYTEIFEGRFSVSEEVKRNLPEWNSFDRFADNWITRLAWVVIYSLFYIKFATSWWMFLLLPIHFAMGPVHGAIINWCAHIYGYINFKSNDTSKNFLPFDFLMMGESYHNNHHTNSSGINFGSRWFEIDPTYQIFKLLKLFGIVY